MEWGGEEDGPVVAEGQQVLLPCRRCGALALRFVVKAVTQDMICPRCGGAIRVAARHTGGR
jgi:hypothetical protein